MTRVQEIESAVDPLSQRDYGTFRRWFLERDWAKRDRQIESDSAAGKLDFLIKEAQEAKIKRTLKGTIGAGSGSALTMSDNEYAIGSTSHPENG